MKLLTKGWATLAALVAGGLLALSAAPALASKVEQPGAMTIVDDAGLFSESAKRQAQEKFAARFDRGLHFTVDTYKAIPDNRKGEYKADAEAGRFFKDWANSVASGDRAKGPFVLICMSPGWTEVRVDEESLNRGFTQANAGELQKIFDTAMRESGPASKSADEKRRIRDAALLSATDFVIRDLRGTAVVHTDGTPLKDGKPATTAPAKKAGMSIGGWICLGLVVLLAIWLVVGIIRALTSPSYGGGYGGGGYGGGGGGFGFGTALLGGMFGAMAGMWMYNSMMGTHYPPQAFGGEASAAGDTGADTGDTGAGDYSDGTGAGGGGDYGDGDGGGGGDYGGGGGGGDYGGGDYGGGGGGDYGGGGDFGGGGGGDYGGGGDF